MKISLAQINTKVGDIQGNARKVLEWTDKASRAGAELVVFPETTLTGYPAWDLLEDRNFVECNLEALKTLSRQVGETACLVGYVDINPSGHGKPLLNCAALIHRRRITAKRAKTLLPTYDVFDEARYFESAASNLPIKFGKARLAVTICEDMWNEEGLRPQRLYRVDPVQKLLRTDPDVLVNLSASPYHRGKVPLRLEMLRSRARKNRVPVIYCNMAGANDELIFDGNSLVIDSNGNLLARGRAFEEDLITVDLANKPPSLAWQDTSEAEELHKALSLGIRDYAGKCGFARAVLGLSGGIDSAVVCALAAEALGPENVTGVSMPSPYTSSESMEDAKELAENLGIKFLQIPISPVYHSYLEQLRPSFGGRQEDTAEQNIQARIRGSMLMALSNKFGMILLSTGNKSETAMGYCTLYGDMSGGLSVLSDVLKTSVYALAGHINRKTVIIPQRTIDRAPTAELKPGQKDQDDLPPYEMLDRIIRAYVEEGKDTREINGMGFPADIVSSVLDRIDRNEYKRRQAPPGLKVSAKAFGIGRKMPIARGYHR